mmetsp:Transcript_38056/g.76967  ORF Transcript_38056/g.76967 Transcript_38056/m.76967 type:complete len:358 (-) Transcript_38056:36-1109(-)
MLDAFLQNRRTKRFLFGRMILSVLLCTPLVQCSMDWNPGSRALEGKVCLVTGASRGVGKGIALGLGEQGATVYLTGRSKTDLQSAADEVSRKGGRGIPLLVDHSKDAEIQGLFKQIQKEEGKLHVLVNNCYSGVEGLFSKRDNTKFWEQGIDWWDRINHVGLRSHFIASQLAVPLIMPGSKQGDLGMIVTVSSFGAIKYLLDVAYGTGKAAKDKMTSDMAEELRGTGITAVSLWPGVVKTEVVNDKLVLNPEESEDKKAFFRDTRTFEDTLFSGRAVAALARDPARAKYNGKVLLATDLASRYGFTKEDGTKPLPLLALKTLFMGAPEFKSLRGLAPFVPSWVQVPKWVLTLTSSKF